MNILNELAQQGDRPTHDQRDRAVRRMKRDRYTISRLWERCRWYEHECQRLKALADSKDKIT